MEYKKGDRVFYAEPHAPDVRRWGTVSSTNDTYVHVRFDEQVAKLGWDGATSQACRPEQLGKEHP